LHRKMTHYIHRRSHRILGLLGDPDDDLDPPKNMTEQEKQLRKSMEAELTAAAREQTPAATGLSISALHKFKEGA
jgi:hypothetical protein